MTADIPDPDPFPDRQDSSAGPPGTVPGNPPNGGDQPYPTVVRPMPPAGLEPSPSTRRKALFGVGAVVTVAIGLLGVPLGLLAWVMAPSGPAVKVAGGAIPRESQPAQFIAADGWFSLLGLGFGVLAAVAVWLILRRSRGPVTLVSVVLGSSAAGWIAWWLSRTIVQNEYRERWEAVAVGETFSLPSAPRAGGFEWLFGLIPYPYGVPLLPAFGAVVTYTLLAGWSRYPSLRPEPELNWDWSAPQTPPAAPVPPEPDQAGPPRD